MPSFSRHEVILVRYPFSDLTSSKIRPAVVVGREFRGDLLVVPLTSRTGNMGDGEFILNDWGAAGLNVWSTVKRGIYTVNTSVVLKTVGLLLPADGFASKVVNDTQAQSASERETGNSRRSPYRLRFRLVF